MEWCSCFEYCFPRYWCATDTIAERRRLSGTRNPQYTVRRISSFGQTVVDEDGTEREIARHATLPTALPWSSKPAPVQPGVTESEMKARIDRLPTISEQKAIKTTKTKYLVSQSSIPVPDSKLPLPTLVKSSPNLSNPTPDPSHLTVLTECSKAHSLTDVRDRKGAGDGSDSSSESEESEPASDSEPSSGSTTPPTPTPCPPEHYGTIVFTIHYHQPSAQLRVTLNRLEGLPGTGVESVPFFPVVKLTLLPKNKVLWSELPKSELYPTYNQPFIFPLKQVVSTILRFSVYDSDYRGGSHDAVGHALFLVEDATGVATIHKMKLYKRSQPDNPMVLPGSLVMSLKQTDSLLCIRAIKLLHFRPHKSYPKLYLKLALYSESKKIWERCSPTQSSYEGTVVYFNYMTTVMVVKDSPHCYLVVSLRARDRGLFKADAVLGTLVLGPHLYCDDGQRLSPWGQLLLCPNQQFHFTFPLYL